MDEGLALVDGQIYTFPLQWTMSLLSLYLTYFFVHFSLNNFYFHFFFRRAAKYSEST